jgi:hypothetical protein
LLRNKSARFFNLSLQTYAPHTNRSQLGAVGGMNTPKDEGNVHTMDHSIPHGKRSGFVSHLGWSSIAMLSFSSAACLGCLAFLSFLWFANTNKRPGVPLSLVDG